MFRFLYTLTAWLSTHYEDMPADFKKKFPFSFVRDAMLVLSNFYQNEKIFNDYGKENLD